MCKVKMKVAFKDAKSLKWLMRVTDSFHYHGSFLVPRKQALNSLIFYRRTVGEKKRQYTHNHKKQKKKKEKKANKTQIQRN